MRTKIFILSIFCFILSFGQNRKGQFQLQKSSKSHTLYVCFSAINGSDDIINKILNKNLTFTTFVKANNISFAKGIGFSDKKLNEMMESSKKNKKTGQSIQKLKRIYKVQTSVQDNENILKLAEAFERFSEVEYVSIISNEPINPPYISSSNTTPDLENQQTYLLDNPGINVNYAWSRGITGQNIRVRDVEYGFHKSHEMLMNRNAIQIEPGYSPNLLLPLMPVYNFLDHGTAVMSIMGSAKDNLGISGTAYNASEYVGFLEWTSTLPDRVGAITRSINASRAGDIILYEMQTGGKPGVKASNYVPAEYDNLVWDLTKAATDSGIIIIAAAGNGDENLDDPFYADYNARGNSGAIIVGAGTSNTEHSKLSFSTYGSRVDVQGWGQNVLAAGYGDWKKYDNDNNRTYTMFSGTSSATPIVASAAILIQSYYFQKTGQYMNSVDMRNLLVNTGVTQGGNLMTKIGPLPNIKTAIESLDNTNIFSRRATLNPLKVEVYPNPSSQYISVRNLEDKNINFEIISMTGQSVLKNTTSSDKKIDISHLPNGTYLINATDQQRRVVEKFIKE